MMAKEIFQARHGDKIPVGLTLQEFQSIHLENLRVTRLPQRRPATKKERGRRGIPPHTPPAHALSTRRVE